MKDENIEIVDDKTTEVKSDNNKSDNVVVPKNQEAKDANKATPKVSSNVADNKTVNLVETAVTKGSIGSSVIGNVSDNGITPTGNPLPEPIDITIKKKKVIDPKSKKIRIVSKKEKITSFIVSIFVLVVLAGAGYAAYYFGYKTNPNLYELKTVYIELGDELPNSASYYVISSKPVDDLEYNLDLSNVIKTTVGSYSYTVKHKNVTKTAQIIVQDTKSPILTLKDTNELTFQKDSKITKDDIVISCEDLSNCTYKTEYEIDTEFAGDKEVTIIARDDAGNETKEIVTIKIIDIQKSLICSSPEIPSQEGGYTTAIINTLSFDSNDYLVRKSAVKRHTYTDYTAYFNKRNELNENSDYVFNEINFSYTEPTEPNNNNLTNLNEIVSYYNEIGYTCK